MRRTLTVFAVLGLAAAMYGADDTSASEVKQGDTKQSDAQQIQNLKQQLTDQQKQIEELRILLLSQKKAIDGVADKQAAAQAAAAEPAAAAPAAKNADPKSVGSVASLAPILPPLPAAPAPKPALPPTPAPAPSPDPQADQASPLQIHIGDSTITPVGFMDLTNTWRSTASGASLATNFGNYPYNNAVLGRLTEDKFSAQNSRLGLRVDGKYKGWNLLGYYEGDFVGGLASNNTQVTSNSMSYRLRLFWINARKGPFEFQAGQSWSLLTPNRNGLSALPGDLFYGEEFDVNYLNGLTWGRIPGIRFLWHSTGDKVNVGVSLENADQYFGGSGGGGTPTLPAAFSSNTYNNEVDASQTNDINVPQVAPDVIAKIAIQPNSRVHFEVAGVESTVKTFNPATNTYFTKTGSGGSVNGNFAVLPNLRLITNNFWSDGEGRYIFGESPDFIIRADGSPSLDHAGSTVDGLELGVKKFQFYAYYGGIYADRNTALDANGKSLIGYGYTGSPNSQNRAMQEVTFGLIHTLWKDSKYGALQWMAQYAYFVRNPWYVAANSPKNAHEDAVWFDLRYVLPGTAPTIKY